MNQLQTDNLIALSLLLDEDIYVLNDLPKSETSAVAMEAVEELPELPKAAANPPVVPSLSPPTIAAKEVVIPKIEEQEKPAPAKSEGFEYLGENNKYILIIVDNANEKFLSKTDQAFLTKIISAKKWSLEDVAIVNKANYAKLDFDELKAFFACNKLITFGFNPTALNIVGALANQKSMYKNVAVLGTWDLAKLQMDVSKKTIFWNQLKEF
ncbi:MAG TPA: hypothetical protein VF273_10365 [Pelobium sp.]